MTTATAQAFANIAFIKYWGNRDNALRIPMNGSISMNLDGLFTQTTVSFQPSLPYDELVINGHEVAGPGRERVSYILDLIREKAGIRERAEVMTSNNFPSGAGIASSASAFAALALAGSRAAGLHLSEQDLSRLARRGSGSAARSIPGGFVEWQAGTCEEDLLAFSIADTDHWKLVDCVAIVSASHKKTGSTEGHSLAPTSPLQEARVADAPRRLEICRNAILNCDFDAFASIIELDFRHDAFGDDDIHPGTPLLEVCLCGGHEPGARLEGRGYSGLLHRGCRAQRPCNLPGNRGPNHRQTTAGNPRRAECADGPRRSRRANYQ